RSGKCKTWQSEYKIVRPDGQVKWVYDVSLPFRSEHGEIVGSFGILQDVTELRMLSSTIEEIVASTAATGAEYLESLVIALSNALQVKFAMIGEFMEETHQRVRTVAWAVDGKVEPNLEYDIIDTPCETVLQEDLCYISSDLQDAYPKDQML